MTWISRAQTGRIAVWLTAFCLLTAAAATFAATPVDDVAVGPTNGTFTLDVLANDGAVGDFRPELVTPPLYGSLQGQALDYGGISPWGDAVYVPPPGFSGMDVFAYRLRSAQRQTTSAIATVYVFVGDVQIVSVANPTLALSVPAAANRTSVGLATTLDDPSQRFGLIDAGDAINLRSRVGSGGANVETWDPGSAGTDATIYSANNKAWQRFTLRPVDGGAFEIVSDYTGWLLSADGGNLAARAADGTDAQRWLIKGPSQANPPLVRDELVASPDGSVASGNVLSNETATTIDFIALLQTAPENGTLVGIGGAIYDGIAPWGQFDYQPNPGFKGRDRFTYTVSSIGGSPSRIGTVTIEVGDGGPVAVDDVFGGAVDAVVSGNVLNNDYASLGGFFDPLAQRAFGPLHGSFTGIGDLIYGGITPWGTFDYVPPPGFTGIDIFGYTTTNSGNESTIATVAIAVGPVQIANLADVDLVLHVPATANRTRVQLETASIDPAQDWLIGASAGFTLSNLETLVGGGGSLLETWDPGSDGTDATIYARNDLDWQRFRFQPAGDGSVQIESDHTGLAIGADAVAAGSTVSAVPRAADDLSQRWLIAGTDQNVPPVVAEDFFTMTAGTVLENARVLFNDNTNGFDLFAFLATPPQNGSLVGIGALIYGGLTPWGAFDYQPNPGFVGTDTFTYYAQDSASAAPSRLVTVTITVEPAAANP
ncbi:MAG: Ig-like domain-containing protein [Acidobacteriota bacterium]